MIQNRSSIKDETLAALLLLEDASSPEVYACGSRRFGYSRDYSDFDFFSLNDDDTHEWLEKNGFKISKHTKPEYFDANTCYIYKRGTVTVILVRMVSARLRIHQHIVENNLRPPKGNTDWWNNLYRRFAPELFKS